MEILKADSTQALTGSKNVIDPRTSRMGHWFLSNPDTEDFTFFWNGTPYTFPARSTMEFIVMDATPIEMGSIRREAAIKLARRIFGKSPKYKSLVKESEGRISPVHYDEAKELESYIEMCLTPLPEGEVKIGKRVKKDVEPKIDPKTGNQIIRVYGESDVGSMSLIEEAQNSKG